KQLPHYSGSTIAPTRQDKPLACPMPRSTAGCGRSPKPSLLLCGSIFGTKGSAASMVRNVVSGSEHSKGNAGLTTDQLPSTNGSSTAIGKETPLSAKVRVVHSLHWWNAKAATYWLDTYHGQQKR